MEGLVVLDTCVLFEFMVRRDPDTIVKAMLREGKAAISVLSVYELFSGVELPGHIAQREELINLCRILELSRSIARKASDIFTVLKRKGISMSNEDLLIGTTAIYWKYPLLTLNTKDFQKIPGIEFYQNP